MKRMLFCLIVMGFLFVSSCAPSATPSVTATGLFAEVVSVSPSGSSAATVNVKSLPGAECTIQIKPPTGVVTNALLKKKADANGNVSWTWALASSNRGGIYNFTVTAELNGEKITTYASFNLG